MSTLNAPYASEIALTQEQLGVLALVTNLKAFARNEALEREGLGSYGLNNPTVESLVKAGFLSVNRAGSITPNKDKIRAELKKYPHPTQYKLLGINSFGLFKRPNE